MICVHDFTRGEVSVKVGVMEFGLIQTVCTHEKLKVQCKGPVSSLLINYTSSSVKWSTLHSLRRLSVTLDLRILVYLSVLKKLTM